MADFWSARGAKAAQACQPKQRLTAVSNPLQSQKEGCACWSLTGKIYDYLFLTFSQARSNDRWSRRQPS